MAVDDDSGNFVGYFNYKPPHHPSLEIGLGMHPDWTGRGLGQSLSRRVSITLAAATRLRSSCSVATFNRRAISVYKRVGFVRRRTYMHWTLGRNWSSSRCAALRSLRIDEGRRVEEVRPSRMPVSLGANWAGWTARRDSAPTAAGGHPPRARSCNSVG